MNYSDNNDNLNLKFLILIITLNFALNMMRLIMIKNYSKHNFSQDKFYHIVVSYNWNSKPKSLYR